jgi:hypothetical protein
MKVRVLSSVIFHEATVVTHVFLDKIVNVSVDQPPQINIST